MLKCIDVNANIYKLTIEYKEMEYSYTAQLIQSIAGEQIWWIRAANKKLLRVVYNKATKELKEDKFHLQPASIPDDFLKVLETEFENYNK